jgi:hypothetical protein
LSDSKEEVENAKKKSRKTAVDVKQKKDGTEAATDQPQENPPVVKSSSEPASQPAPRRVTLCSAVWRRQYPQRRC